MVVSFIPWCQIEILDHNAIDIIQRLHFTEYISEENVLFTRQMFNIIAPVLVCILNIGELICT